MDGVSLIAKERRRQIKKEGWTPEHDDEHEDNELSRVAALYSIPPGPARDFLLKSLWPESWSWEWWKPLADDPDEAGASRNAARVRELVKAGALIAAEIDRLQRLAPPPPAPSAQPSQDVAGTSGESLAGLSKEGSETP